MRPDQNTTPHTARRRRPTAFIVGVCTVAALGILGTTGVSAAQPNASSTASLSAGVAQATLASVVAPAAGQESLDELAAEARTARDEGRAALDSAAALSGEIAGAGLDLGDTTIDTAGLEAAVDDLATVDATPALFLAAPTDDAAEATDVVEARVTELRGSLDAALAQKAAEEAAAAAAAAEAARQAEEAAAAAAAAAAQPQVASAPAAPAPAAPAVPSGSAQDIARGMLAGYGWGDDQFGCLVSLWDKESGWNVYANNPSSGAYGIPQALPGSKMASAGADWQTNPATQIAWGFGYIAGRYGTPCGAWSHSQSVGWY